MAAPGAAAAAAAAAAAHAAQAASSTTDQDMSAMLANVHMLRATNHTKSLFTTLRDRTTSRPDFIFTTERLARLIVEEALGLLPSHSKTVTTPVGESYEGIEYARSICGVAIIRAGEAMEAALRTVCRAVRIGKILIQRNMETGERELIYVRLPPDISERYVLLLEPVLASGRSATKAVEVLLEQGVSEEKILFTSLLAAHAGLRLLLTRFPKLKIVCGEIDAEYDGFQILPGIGQFGDRYFGTGDQGEDDADSPAGGGLAV